MQENGASNLNIADVAAKTTFGSAYGASRTLSAVGGQTLLGIVGKAGVVLTNTLETGYDSLRRGDSASQTAGNMLKTAAISTGVQAFSYATGANKLGTVAPSTHLLTAGLRVWRAINSKNELTGKTWNLMKELVQ